MARLILLALMAIAYPFSDRLAGNPVLYMFAHASLAHLAINAITLWSFGKPAERDLGPALTILVFMLAAIAGGMVQAILTPDSSLMGASAGILALVAFFVAENPTRRIGLPLLMVRGPIVLGIMIALSIACLIFGWWPHVAHAAHLTGIVIGLLLALC